MTDSTLLEIWATVAVALTRSDQPGGSLGIPPGPLAGPLHFPNPGLARWPILALLAIAGLWWLYRRWQRRQQQRTAPSAAAVRPELTRPQPRVPKEPTFGQILHRLLERILASRAYREGCHELAILLKGRLETEGRSSKKRLPYTRMTEREIQRATGSLATSELLVRLADLRFRREAPDRSDFEQVCRRAQQVTGRKATGRRRVTEQSDGGGGR